MWRIWRRWRQRAALLGVVAVAVIYFGYHAMYGRLGLLAWDDLKAEIATTETALEAVETENERLRREIRGLRPEHPEPDTVETALRELGYIREEEQILLQDQDGER